MRCVGVLMGLGVALWLPSAAGAARCSFTDSDRFPGISNVRVYGITCSTAKRIGNESQDGIEEDQEEPDTVRANGLRFRCRYTMVETMDSPYVVASCRRSSRPKQRATLRLTS